MSKTVTIQLPDEVYETLQRMAERDGMSLESLVIEWLAKYGPRPVAKRTPQELNDARKPLLQFAGMHHGNNAHGSENEGIDIDLTREYLDPHRPRQ